MNTIDIAVLLIYIAGVTVFGAYFYRRSLTNEGFTRTNRRLPGWAVALLMVSSKQVLDDWWRFAGIFSGGMLGLFLLGILSRRAASGQAIVGMIAGLLVIIWATFSRNLEGPLANSLHAFMTTVLGTLTIFFVGILLSRWRVRQARGEPPLTLYDLR